MEVYLLQLSIVWKFAGILKRLGDDSMSRYKKTTASNYEKLKKEGRGQGRGEDYKPWLTVRDVPSDGLSTRIPGWTTGRVHHFFSKLESSYFYCLEWSPFVTDIREQFPLQIDTTLEIAERLGIKHPYVNHLNDYAVMTTDFLVDVNADNKPRMLARSIKPESELASKRTIEKILIEKTYWEDQGIDFKVVTEREISKNLSENVDFIYTAKHLEDSPGIDLQMLFQIESVLYKLLKDSTQGLSKTALQIDHQLGLKPGSSLWVVRYLIANGIWSVDMTIKINPSEPLVFARRNMALLKELNAG